MSNIPQMPGSLEGSASIEIHTKQCYRMVYSLKSDGTPSPMTGLLRFAKRMVYVWEASRQDDPFADHFLELIDNELKSAHDEIKTLNDILRSGLRKEKSKGVEINVANSSSPLLVPLQFSIPFGFMGAYLIADCDRLIRTCYTCKHVGLLSNTKTEKNIRKAMNTVLHVFELQRDYKFFGVTREDAMQNNVKWNDALSAMGEISQSIIDGHRPKIAPHIAQSTADKADVIELNKK